MRAAVMLMVAKMPIASRCSPQRCSDRPRHTHRRRPLIYTSQLRSRAKSSAHRFRFALPLMERSRPATRPAPPAPCPSRREGGNWARPPRGRRRARCPGRRSGRHRPWQPRSRDPRRGGPGCGGRGLGPDGPIIEADDSLDDVLGLPRRRAPVMGPCPDQPTGWPGPSRRATSGGLSPRPRRQCPPGPGRYHWDAPRIRGRAVLGPRRTDGRRGSLAEGQRARLDPAR